MIVTESRVVLFLFLWGAAAGVTASALNVLGRASRPARCITDALIALAFGGAYIVGLFFAANGEFRAYSLIAFALGSVCAISLCKRFYPYLKKAAKYFFSPLISLERKLEKRFADRLRPLVEKQKARIAARKERKRKKKEERGEKTLLRRKKCADAKSEKEKERANRGKKEGRNEAIG